MVVHRLTLVTGILEIDGTTSDACSESHIYANPGNYTAIVTVTDSEGQTASDSIEGFLITNTGGNNTGGIPSNWHPPVITVPDDITVQAIGPEGAPVSFEVTATETLEGDTYTLPSPPIVISLVTTSQARHFR